ncbi:cytochrome b/b6 domain-containing protein [Azohydromonas caseinilytica]|uniref:Cytochrome B n=1 Tax=Azohydromonas caseinilytica TaxID=2728836 RepID=A0A848FC79_9BURK|nr:cytochrome b/b6 domain-containing protein [Azohydromonas caseinilytica]NML15913.1 cytochrome B [Azohydromonas caseinilytica]
MDNTAVQGSPGAVAVWDPFVRVFHWSLVGCVLLDQFVLEEGEAPHRWVGYAAAALVLARVVWGFVGSRHARFADFFPTPARVHEHARALLQGRHPTYLGHSPLGALMMLTLMALVLALGVTGWLQGTDAFWGEEWLQELHEGLAEVLIWAAGVHALAAIVLGRLERVGLVRAMLTGTKRSY